MAEVSLESAEPLRWVVFDDDQTKADGWLVPLIEGAGGQVVAVERTVRSALAYLATLDREHPGVDALCLDSWIEGSKAWHQVLGEDQQTARRLNYCGPSGADSEIEPYTSRIPVIGTSSYLEDAEQVGSRVPESVFTGGRLTLTRLTPRGIRPLPDAIRWAKGYPVLRAGS